MKLKNKLFSNRHSASYYFHKVSRNYVAYLIHETNSDVYMVINQDLYDEYSKNEDMNIDLLHMSC
jgi:hypothetical protein